MTDRPELRRFIRDNWQSVISRISPLVPTFRTCKTHTFRFYIWLFMLSRTRALGGVFPPELYFLILDQLAQIDKTCQSAIAILNLALSYNSMYGLVCAWAIHAANGYLQKIKAVQGAGLPTGKNQAVGLQSPLTIICKDLSGLCTICDMRASGEEIFTDLRLCTCCDVECFGKISHNRLTQLIEYTPLGLQEKEFLVAFCVKTPFGPPDHTSEPSTALYGPVYSWSLVNELADRGHFKRIDSVEMDLTNQSEAPGEGYSHFSEINDQQGWSEELWRHAIIWDEACNYWDSEHSTLDRGQLGPVMVDLILLWSFRYQFDPHWTPRDSIEEEVLEYTKLAQSWIHVSQWQDRPWGIKNFPFQPQICMLVASNGSGSIKAETKQAFQSYRHQCRKLRALLKVSPESLRFPRLWRKHHLAEFGLGEVQDLDVSDPCQSGESILNRPTGQHSEEVSLISVGEETNINILDDKSSPRGQLSLEGRGERSKVDTLRYIYYGSNVSGPGLMVAPTEERLMVTILRESEPGDNPRSSYTLESRSLGLL